MCLSAPSSTGWAGDLRAVFFGRVDVLSSIVNDPTRSGTSTVRRLGSSIKSRQRRGARPTRKESSRNSCDVSKKRGRACWAS